MRLLRVRVLYDMNDLVKAWQSWCRVIASPRLEQQTRCLILLRLASPLSNCDVLQCEATFCSEEANVQHERIKRQMWNPMRACAFGDGGCRACK
eukprot:2711689-Pyramimonas_sp.AAC.1